ncbi:MAG: stage II sporulation protein R [Oscillospiraceae bacterium]
MKKSDKIIISLAGMLFIGIFAVTMGGFSNQCEEVRNSTLRLHIIANSDNQADQDLKFKVRDAVLKEYGKIMEGCANLPSAEKTMEFLKPDIEKTALKTLQSNKCNDEVSVSLTKMYFNNRKYDEGVTLPAGEYEALRIVIGDGEGKNWWCVMYPPICIPAACSRDATEIEEKIRDLSRTPNYEAKFYCIELLERLRKNV